MKYTNEEFKARCSERAEKTNLPNPQNLREGDYIKFFNHRYEYDGIIYSARNTAADIYADADKNMGRLNTYVFEYDKLLEYLPAAEVKALEEK